MVSTVDREFFVVSMIHENSFVYTNVYGKGHQP